MADSPLRLAMAELEAPRLLELDVQGRVTPVAPTTPWRTPLGSVWKLFVHAYLLQQRLPEQPYVCHGGDREELYCCAAGERIEREQALLQSCGHYYQPQRLAIDAASWRRFWAAQAAPEWLQDLQQLQPGTEVAVLELLQVLQRLPAQAELRALLLEAALRGESPFALQLGGQLRIKTWSWHQPSRPAQAIGGFAGWLADGTALWAQASGSSRAVLARYSEALSVVLPVRWPREAGGCVDVQMFARYPIRHLWQHGVAQSAGRLHGRYEVEFAAGNRFAIESAGELILSGAAPNWQLIARLEREDYVARVLQREAAAEPLAAARALAVLIRSYLLQNAEPGADCLRIDDSSATQRVAAQPATAASRAATAWSAGLVLDGETISYHRDRAAPGRFSWSEAVARAGSGQSVQDILQPVFPRADWARWDAPRARCESLLEAEQWLLARQQRWRERLQAEVGYEAPGTLQVCRLLSGRPHVDRQRQRIFVRGLRHAQDRLDLTHEYLHLAFAAHPRGQDETYIEALTRSLLLP